MTTGPTAAKLHAGSVTMSLPRFHLPASSWSSQQLCLADDEAAHCARVMRKAPGDRIEIFDGEGRLAECEITHVGKNAVQAQIVAESRIEPFRTAIHLFPALIKAEPFEWLLEKAVELCAAGIHPVVTERTMIHLDAAQAGKKLARWRRHMIESAKQCHTPFVPWIEGPVSFRSVVSDIKADMKLMPALSEHSRTLKQLIPPSPPGVVAVLIGPEGDFSPEEEAEAQQAGFLPVTLGPLILRAETAAISTLAILGHELRC
jgi:16S rRNA (uracil1498-N3)-methyltransferase